MGDNAPLIDAILIVLLYERTAKWFGDRQTLRILVSSMLVLTLDQVGFFAALFVFIGVPLQAFWGGWIAKMGAAAVYSGLTGLYLRYGERQRPSRAEPPRLTDVFDTLTYRERYEALLRDAGRDALTGLLDRGRFDRDCALAVADAVTRRRPVSLHVIDIDHFKRVNDVYGHAAGDEALRVIARELAAAVRESDGVYRYGGEEFVIVCDGLPHKAAMLAGERLRIGVSLLKVKGVEVPITASVGVATCPEDGTDLVTLFATADARLYQAKEAGRDRVVGWSAPPTEDQSVIRFQQG